MSELKTVGERLAHLRGKSGQEEFAKLIGIGRSSLIRYEKNERSIDADLIARLWVLFRVDVVWLITGIKSGNAVELTPNEAELLALYRAAPTVVKAAGLGALKAGISSSK